MTGTELIRSTIFHTTGDPYHDSQTFVAIDDGGLLVRDGRIAACGDFAAVRAAHADAPVTDWRGGYVLPGLVDTHVHFPQLRVIGHLGGSLLDWLEHAALPEETRMADVAYARDTARRFVHALVSHGTTTASVFGAHFAPATAELFDAAEATGMRIAAGLVLSDRQLRPELHTTIETAYRESTALVRRYHGHGRALYSVTPRFALSASEAMLEVCQTLMREQPSIRCQSHINEQRDEIDAVAKLFPWAEDYLGVYERFGLVGDCAILAHDVHATSSEIERLADSGTAVAHCPASNAALGSGIFPLRRHLEAGVRCALGTDVGGGVGFGVLKEALQAYLMQRSASEPMGLTPPHLLYLATRAGAEALGLAHLIGDFETGKAADLVHLRPPDGSVLAGVLRGARDLDHVLSALITLAGAESIRDVRVDGDVVYRSEAA
jgi:guanine deaminase